MTWFDRLQRIQLSDGRVLIGASFRGVPFFVESTEMEGGRRTVAHEVIGGTTAYVDDLGRRTPTFTIRGYVVGDDYITMRDDLLDALDGVAGPGELVEPHLGVITASAESFSLRETRDDGGIAIFSIRFRESLREPLSPSVLQDADSQVAVSATAADSASVDEFSASYEVDDEPGFSLESLERELAETATAMADALSPIATTVQEAASVNGRARVMAQQAASIIRDPVLLTDSVRGVIDALGDTALFAPREMLNALVDVYNQVGSVADAVGDTATRVRERANQAALRSSLRRAVLVSAVGLAPSVNYETESDARSTATLLSDLIDQQSVGATTETYSAMVQLRADLRRSVPGDAILARLLSVERLVPTPSLLLSYQLYGSVQLESDIIARNSVSHPAFIAGSLSVLSS